MALSPERCGFGGKGRHCVGDLLDAMPLVPEVANEQAPTIEERGVGNRTVIGAAERADRPDERLLLARRQPLRIEGDVRRRERLVAVGVLVDGHGDAAQIGAAEGAEGAIERRDLAPALLAPY